MAVARSYRELGRVLKREYATSLGKRKYSKVSYHKRKQFERKLMSKRQRLELAQQYGVEYNPPARFGTPKVTHVVKEGKAVPIKPERVAQKPQVKEPPLTKAQLKEARPEWAKQIVNYEELRPEIKQKLYTQHLKREVAKQKEVRESVYAAPGTTDVKPLRKQTVATTYITPKAAAVFAAYEEDVKGTILRSGVKEGGFRYLGEITPEQVQEQARVAVKVGYSQVPVLKGYEKEVMAGVQAGVAQKFREEWRMKGKPIAPFLMPKEPKKDMLVVPAIVATKPMQQSKVYSFVSPAVKASVLGQVVGVVPIGGIFQTKIGTTEIAASKDWAIARAYEKEFGYETPVKEKYRALRSQKEEAIVKFQKRERESAERWAPYRKQVEKVATLGGLLKKDVSPLRPSGIYQDIVRFGGNIPYIITEFPFSAATKAVTIGTVARYEPTTTPLVKAEFKRTLPEALKVYKRPSTYIIAAAMAYPIAKAAYIKSHTKVYTKSYQLRQKTIGKKAVEFGKVESHTVIHTPKLLNLLRGKKFIQPRVIQTGVIMKGHIIQKGQMHYTRGKIRGVQREIIQAPKGTLFSRHVKPLIKTGKTWKFKHVKEIKGTYQGDIVSIISKKGQPVLYSRLTQAHIKTISKHTLKIPQYKLFKGGYKLMTGKQLPKHHVFTRVKQTSPMTGMIERVYDTGVLKGRPLSRKVMRRYWEIKGMTGKIQKVPEVNLKYITRAYTPSGKIKHFHKYKHVVEGTTIQMRKLSTIRGQQFYRYKGGGTLHLQSPYKTSIVKVHVGGKTRPIFRFEKKVPLMQRFDKYITKHTIIKRMGKKGTLMLKSTHITRHHPLISQPLSISHIAPTPIGSIMPSLAFKTYPTALVAAASVAALSVADTFARTRFKPVSRTRMAPITRHRYQMPQTQFQFAPVTQQYKFEQIAAQIVVPKEKDGTSSKYATTQTMPGGLPPPTPPGYMPTPPFIPPPPPFFPGFGLPEGFVKGARKTKAPTGKHIKKYQPSIAALTFGIYGEKPIGKLTGLEERPIIGEQRTPKGLNIFSRASTRKFKRGKSVFEKQLEQGFIRGRARMEGF